MRRRHLGAIFLPPIAIIVITALLPAVAQATPLADKRAQAKRVQQQIGALDVRLEMAIEQYNMANIKLSEVQARVGANQARLEIARDNLERSRVTLAARAVAIYKERSVDFLDVVLSTESFDELVSSLDMLRRLGENDSNIVDSVENLKKEIAERRVQLLADQKKAEKLLAQRVAMRDQIASSLQERERMLKGVKTEIARLERQARLAAQRAAAAAAAAARAAAGAAPNVPIGGYGSHTGTGAHPEVVAIAQKYLGVPYVYAGASPSTGFDCSGFTMYCYAQIGISLPHNAQMQHDSVQLIARDSLQPGDLCFFGYSSSSIHHVGIYVGGGTFIHAPHTGDVVSYQNIGYSDFYCGGRP